MKVPSLTSGSMGCFSKQGTQSSGWVVMIMQKFKMALLSCNSTLFIKLLAVLNQNLPAQTRQQYTKGIEIMAKRLFPIIALNSGGLLETSSFPFECTALTPQWHLQPHYQSQPMQIKSKEVNSDSQHCMKKRVRSMCNRTCNSRPYCRAEILIKT